MSIDVIKRLLQTLHGVLFLLEHLSGFGFILISTYEHGEDPQYIGLDHKRITFFLIIPLFINFPDARTDICIYFIFPADTVLEITSPLYKGLQILRVKYADLLCNKFRRKDHDQKLHIIPDKIPPMRFYVVKDDHIILLHRILLSIDKIIPLPLKHTGDLKVTVPVPGPRPAVLRGQHYL